MGLLDFLTGGSTTALRLPSRVETDAAADVSNLPGMFEVRGSRDPFINSMTGLGTDRDPRSSEQARWTFEPMRKERLEALYRLEGLPRRIVELPPTYATQAGAESWSIRDASEDAAPLEDVAVGLNLHQRVYAADVAARLYGDSAIYMVVEEGGALSDQALPLDLDAVTGMRDLLVVEAPEMEILEVQREVGSLDGPSFGEPILWRLNLQRNGVFRSFTVHASRLVLFSGAHVGFSPTVVTSKGWGHDSVLEGAVGAIMGLNDARRGRSRVFERIMTWWAKTTFPTGAQNLKSNAEEMLTGLKNRFALLRVMTSLGVGLLHKDEEIQQLNAPVSGVAELSDSAAKDLCRSTGLPMGLLDGEIGGWSRGEGWQAGWRVQVASYQKNRYTGPLTQIYTVLFAIQGEVPLFSIEFAPLESLGPLEVAEERLLIAQADQLYAEMFPEAKGAIRRSRMETGFRRVLQPMLPEEIDVEEAPDLSALLSAAPEDPTEDASGDADTLRVPAYISAAARLGQRLRREFGRGASWAPEGEVPQGVVSARMLASGKVTRGFVRSKMLPFLTRHLKQVAAGGERQSEGWQNPRNPSPRWVALLLWGENGGGRAFRWAQQQVKAAQADALAKDADLSDSALVTFDLAPEDIEAWKALQAVVAAIVPLEGYDPGDPMPSEPHATLLYLGTVRRAFKTAVAAALGDTFADNAAPLPEVIGVRCFEAQGGRCPVVIELRPKGLAGFYRRALRALAPYVSAEQWPDYRPHVTLGFARVTDEQRSLIESLPVHPLRALPALRLVWQGTNALTLNLE